MIREKDDFLYWLWITNIKGISDKKVDVLLEFFSSPKEVFYSSFEHFKLLFNTEKFSEEDYNLLEKSKNYEKILSYVKKLEEHNIDFSIFGEEHYPKSLEKIYNPPKVLYFRGNKINDNIKIGIVGSRNCSQYGKSIAEYFGYELSQYGVTVVSGMARGIDTYAHKGAIKANKETIAVLGCGLNVCYPKENYGIMNSIKENGTILSEYHYNSPPNQWNFPNRNRIISGISNGILVIEAAEKSGSLITADFGLEQGKDIFAVPGKILDKYSKGTNNLIKQGAKIVTDIEDILEEYVTRIIKEEKQIKPQFSLNELNENEKRIFSNINIEPIGIDDLYNSNDINIRELLNILTKLEFKGLIKQLPNKHFCKSLI